MEHIEKNRCKKIKNDDYAARREEKLAFARELQRRHRGEDVQLPGEDLSVASLSLDETTTNKKEPYNFTQFLSRAKDIPAGVPSLSSLRPEAEKTIQPNPVTFAMKKEERPQVVLKKSEYPQLGSKLADLPTGRAGQKGDNKAGNAWGQGKKLFPDAPPAVRPAPEVLQKPAPASEPMEAAWPEHDPRNPLWDPSVYYVTYSNKYKCPIDRCPYAPTAPRLILQDRGRKY
jgi:palmitoyltransferase